MVDQAGEPAWPEDDPELRRLDAELEARFGETLAGAASGELSAWDIHRFEEGLKREEWAERARPVIFRAVAEWTPEPDRRFIFYIAFPERLIAFAEFAHKDNNAAIRAVEKFLAEELDYLYDHGWSWLAPYLQRLAAGEDIESDLLDRVRSETGADAAVLEWTIVPENFRRRR